MDHLFDQNYFEDFSHSNISQFNKVSVQPQKKAQAVSNISELIQRIEQESKLELQKHKKAEKQTKSILINMGYQFRGGTQNTNVRKTPNSRQRTNGEAANGNASLDKNNTSVTSNPLLTRKRRHNLSK